MKPQNFIAKLSEIATYIEICGASMAIHVKRKKQLILSVQNNQCQKGNVLLKSGEYTNKANGKTNQTWHS